MRVTSYYLGATFLGLAAILTLGCDDSRPPAGPVTGAIEITVATASASIDIDPDGYSLSIDGGPGLPVGVNAAVTIGALPTGKHLVRLDGVAPNCSVSGTNPRSREQWRQLLRSWESELGDPALRGNPREFAPQE